MTRSSAALRKVEARSLRERVEALQIELKVALTELALEMREESRRSGPQVEGHAPPPLEYFHRQLLCARDETGNDAYSIPCKCHAVLASKRE